MNEIISHIENKYSDERCFILGTGPSIEDTNIQKLVNEYTFLSGWFAIHKDYPKLRKSYYCMSDPGFWNRRGRLDELFYQLLKSNLETLYFLEHSFYEKNQRYRYFPNEKVTYMHFSDDGIRNGDRIETDIKNPIPLARTVVQDLILPLIYYMGFKKIYLIGCDFTHIPNTLHPHFYSKNFMSPKQAYFIEQTQGVQLTNVRKPYKKFKDYFENNDRYIYDATIGGKLEVFEQVKYDSLF